MAFQLAEAFVELNARGFRTVMGAIDGVKSRLGSVVSLASGPLAASLAAVGAGAGVGSMLKMASDAEQTEVAFSTMLGSTEKARKLLGELATFAAKTPFEMPGIKQSARTLLAFGKSQEEVLPLLRILGDVSAGTGKDLAELTVIFGQISATGKLMGGDLMQLTNAGVPMLKTLGEMLGKSTGSVKKMVEDGEIGADLVTAAFQRMSGQGGVFANMMAKQSGTLGGLWSSLSDAISQSMTKTGTALVETFNLKSVVKNMTNFVEYFSSTWSPRILAGLKAVGDAFSWYIDVVISTFKPVYEAMIESFPIAQITTAFQGFASYFTGTLWPTINKVYRSILQVAVMPLIAEIKLIGAIATWTFNSVLKPLFNWAMDMGAKVTKNLDMVGIRDGVTRLEERFAQFAEFVQAKFLPPIAKGLAWVSDSFIKPAVEWLGRFGKSFNDTVGFIASMVSELISDWDLYWELAYTSLANSMLNMWEQVKAFFNNAVSLAGWYYESIIQVFSNIYNNAGKIFGLLIDQFKNNWQSFLNFIKTGKLRIDSAPLAKSLQTAFKGIKPPKLVTPELNQMAAELDRIQDQLSQRQIARAEARARRERELSQERKAMVLDEEMSESEAARRAADKEIEKEQSKTKELKKQTDEKKKQTAGFVSLAELADKMQEEALKKDKKEGPQLRPVMMQGVFAGRMPRAARDREPRPAVANGLMAGANAIGAAIGGDTKPLLDMAGRQLAQMEKLLALAGGAGIKLATPKGVNVPAASVQFGGGS